MNEIKSSECVYCPLLDRAIDNECPDAWHKPAITGGTQRSFPAGTQLFEEGKPIAGIHCLRSGRAALVKRREEENLVVAVVTPGDVLGMPDILGGDIHQNGALAIEDSSICFIPKEKALELLTTNPHIMVRIMCKICERIRSMEHYIDKQYRTSHAQRNGEGDPPH